MAEDPDAEVGRGQIGGNQGRRMASARSSLKIDATAIQNLAKELDKVTASTTKLKSEMKLLADEAERYGKAIKGAGAPGGYGTGTPRPAGSTLLPPPPPGAKPVNADGGAAAAADDAAEAARKAGAARAGAIGFGINMAAGLVGSGVGAMDRRIDRGTQYATSMDRLNFLTQQMTGMSQAEVIRQRRPLTNYRLGEGGINAMVEFQSRTGVAATPQFAEGLEALRASSGYGKTTQDLLTEQRQLMDPDVANKMLFTMGTNVFNVGGGMKDPFQFRQEAVKALGLTDPAIARGALTPGSMTRARMSQLGFGEEMQTSLIQYAQQQIQFEKAGGKGMYDPSDPAHLKTMGVSEKDQLAIQQEETTRLQQLREENFAGDQIKAMAALEVANQKLIKVMTQLDETLKDVYDLRIKTRPYARAAGGILKGVGTGALLVGGAAMAATGVGSPLGIAMMGIGAAGLVGGAALEGSGDPMIDEAGQAVVKTTRSAQSSGNDRNIKVPYGYGNTRISLEELKGKSNFQKLHPTMQSRLLQMMRTNPNVGIGQGFRDSESQKKMFLERYQRTEKGDHDLEWNGAFWKRVVGAPAAPPGRSMHEIGLAADLVGDLAWANANAGKFGLKHFANVNNEPWHFQPAELPNSRKKYEDAGAPWGTDGGYVSPGLTAEGEDAEFEILGDNGNEPAGHRGPLDTSGVSGVNYSLSELMAQNLEEALVRFSSTNGTYQPASPYVGRTGANSNAVASVVGSGAALAASAAHAVGFRNQDLLKIVAIAGRESGWDPSAINKSSNDTGMWQIAPINWGEYTQQQLLNAQNNADVAMRLFKSGGFSPWKATSSRRKNDKGTWVVDPTGKGSAGWAKDGDELWNTEKHMPEARAAVAPYSMSGDPVFDTAPTRSAPSSGGSSKSNTMHISSSPTINVAPVINFNGTPSTPDLRSIAQTVSAMIREEVALLDLRTA